MAGTPSFTDDLKASIKIIASALGVKKENLGGGAAAGVARVENAEAKVSGGETVTQSQKPATTLPAGNNYVDKKTGIRF